MKSQTFFNLIAVTALCVVMTGCENIPPVDVAQVSNVTFTECNNTMKMKNADANNGIVVEFTNAGVHITHYGLEVNCDFDTVIVTQALQNGVLNITEKGEPDNVVRCLCSIDVSYTVHGISESEVNTIIINGKVVWGKNDCNIPLDSTLWASSVDSSIKNFEFGRVYVINTVDELLQHPYFFQDGVSIPDLTTKSILVNYFGGCGFYDVKSVFCAENGYHWNIAYYALRINCLMLENAYNITYMFVDKIPDNSTVTLNTSFVYFNEPMTKGNVLMLKVDYLTNTFEGGYEFAFDNVPNSFTVRREYKSPGDFGYVKFFYYETLYMLFLGSIFWMGEGQIHFPENLLPASAFNRVDMKDFVIPKNGFENIMPEYMPNNIDYEDIWGNIQNLVKIREYLGENPKQKVKIFLYTPCVGTGDPAHWDWILFLKK